MRESLISIMVMGILVSQLEAEDALLNAAEPAMKKQISKVATSHNTQGFLPDIFESLLQKLDWTGLASLLNQTYQSNIDKRVSSYRSSIESGHKVLAVAHSQGNLFTNDSKRIAKEGLLSHSMTSDVEPLKQNYTQKQIAYIQNKNLYKKTT